MDNRIFNVNGKSDALLEAALKLVFTQIGEKTTCKAYSIDPKAGLILLWHSSEKSIPFPTGMTAEQVVPIVSQWLKSEEAKKIECTSQWDKNIDFDGSTSLGWRVYCEDWGHVAGHHNAICAVKPSYMWHGK